MMDFDDNLLINLNDLAEPPLPSASRGIAWPMPNIIDMDSNPFDQLAQLSDPNDPFESVFNTAKTYSAPVEQKSEQKSIGNILLDDANVSNISFPSLLTSSSMSGESELEVPESTLMESDNDLREMIRLRVDKCIKSAKGTHSESASTSAAVSPPRPIVRSSSASQLEPAPQRSRSSSLTSVSTTTSSTWEMDLLDTAFRNFSSISSLSSGHSAAVSDMRHLRLTSAPCKVSTELLCEREVSAVPRHTSDPSTHTQQLQEAVAHEANHVAKLLSSSEHDDSDVLEIADDTNEVDDEVFVREMRRQSIEMDTAAAQTQPSGEKLPPTVEAGVEKARKLLGQSEPGAITADLLAGKLGHKFTAKPAPKPGPMRATVPVQAMTKHQAFAPLTPPDLRLVTPTPLVAPGIGLKFDHAIYSSTPKTSVAEKLNSSFPSSSHIALAPHTPIRRSRSSTSIPSPQHIAPSPIALQHIGPPPSPAKPGVLATRNARGIPSPVKRGIPVPKLTTPSKVPKVTKLPGLQKPETFSKLAGLLRGRSASLPSQPAEQPVTGKPPTPKRPVGGLKSVFRRNSVGKENVKP